VILHDWASGQVANTEPNFDQMLGEKFWWILPPRFRMMKHGWWLKSDNLVPVTPPEKKTRKLKMMAFE